MSIELTKSDVFFYHGQGDLGDEIASDIQSIMLQQGRSLLYSRAQGSANMDTYENTPNTIQMRVIVPFEIVQAISKRNSVVGNGQDNTKERRVASSQNLVQIKQKSGEMDITVLYIPYFDQSNKVVINNHNGLVGGI